MRRMWHWLFGGYTCDGCRRRVRRWRGRATPRIERVAWPLVGGIAEGECAAVRLYCRACADARKEES